jgi:hypothetical protein
MGRPDLVGASYQTHVFTNDGYQDSPSMASHNSMDAEETAPIVGVLGLSMLSVLILGVMVFYVGTRGRQA